MPHENIKIVQIKRSELKPFPKNARTHSDEQILQIVRSIRSFGFVNPILVRADMTIIAGHGRVLAAGLIKRPTVPCIILDGLTDDEARALTLADNQIASNAGWDVDMLNAELRRLSADVNMAELGFDIRDIGTKPDLTEDDWLSLLDPGGDTVSRQGDLWKCGDHLVLCSAADVATIDAFGDDETTPLGDMVFSSGLSGHPTDAAFARAVCAFSWFSKPGAPIYWVSSPHSWANCDRALRLGGFHWSTTIIWDKGAADAPNLHSGEYLPQYRPILYGWKEGAKRLKKIPDRTQSDLWVYPFSSYEPPLELIGRAICNSSMPGDLVVDPFAGCGSTLIAADRCGRRAHVANLNPDLVDIILRRWMKEHPGEEPILADADGLSFSDIEYARGDGRD